MKMVVKNWWRRVSLTDDIITCMGQVIQSYEMIICLLNYILNSSTNINS